jgi:enediyne biosynthesis protein E4
VTTQSGIAAGEPSPYYDCWGASACDYNGDGRTDLFVSTYRLAPDLLYRNNGDGTFSEVGAASGAQGVPTAAPGYFGHGMGSDWGDFDNDGRPDLAVGNLGHPDWRGQWSNPSLIFRNTDGATFHEQHLGMGLKFFEMNAGVTWADLDLDGTLDLWQSQYAYNAAGVNGEPRRLSRVYVSDGAPTWRLRDRTWHLGSLVHGAWAVSRLDADQDGDVDIVAASPTEGVRLFRNDIARRGTWLAVRVHGPAAGPVSRDALGTRIIVHANGTSVLRDLSTNAAGSRAATNSLEQFFGLGAATVVDSLVVLFPDGTRQTYPALAANRRYGITYGGGISVGTDAPAAPGQWAIADARWAHGTVSFQFTAPQPFSRLRADIVDLLGRRAGGSDLSGRTSGTVSFRPSGPLPSGAYLLVVSGDGGMRTARLLVLR